MSVEYINGPLTVSEGTAAVLDAVQRLSLARTMPDIQHVVRGVARSLAGADGATFVLREGESCFYADEDAIAPLWKGQRFPLGACISGWAMLNRRQVVIPDIYVDSRIPHDAYRPTFVKSLAMTPIRRLDPLGAIGTYWARHHVPSDEHLYLLQALADSTAVAIENVGMLERLDYQVRLLHTLAHEVRNPLTAARALLDQVSGQGDIDPRVELAEDALGEAVRIVNEQLDVSKLQAGEERVRLEDVALAPLLEGLRDSYAALARRRVALVADIEPGLNARTDPRLVSQIVRNLLSNALKFTDHGEIRIRAARRRDMLEVVVSDTGVGVAAGDQDRIFAEFQQVDDVQHGRRPGTGLGLPLARRLARALGGDIHLRSAPGVGSEFSLVLPA